MRCIFPECTKKTKARGLCSSHYQAAWGRIRGGRADEKDLIARGLLLPGKKDLDVATTFDKGRKETGDGI